MVPVAGGRLVEADRAQPDRWFDNALALATVVAATALVVHRLDVSAWFDEAYSYGMSTQTFSSYLTRWLWGSESNMVAYYLTLRAWLGGLSLAGVAPVEVLLRLPSALFAVGASLMVYLLGRRLFGRVAGLVAAGLYMTNFLQMILAQTARAYTLQLLVLAIAWWCLFSALESGGRRRWVAYGAAVVLSVYSDLFSGLVVAAQVVTLVLLALVPGPWASRVRSQARPIVVTVAVSFVLVLPLVVDSALHGGPVWVPPATLHDVRTALSTMAGNSHGYEGLALGLGALAALGAAIAYVPGWARFSLGSKEALGSVVALAMWFAVPMVLSFAVTQKHLNLHLFYPRYLVVVVPPMALLVGAGVSALRIRALQAVAVVLLAVVAYPPLATYYELSQVQDFKDPVLWLEHRYQPGDGIVCYPEVQCAIPVAYYLVAYPGRARLDSASLGNFSWEGNSSVTVTSANLKAYEANHSRIFFVYAPLGRVGAPDAQAHDLQQLLSQDGYRVVDQTTAHATSSDTTVLEFQKL